MTTRLKAASGPHREGVREANRKVIKLATGSDGLLRPGSPMHEISELVGCGLSGHEAITAATRHTAESVGISKRVGTLKP